MRRSAFIVLMAFLAGCSDAVVDETILSGSWAISGNTCAGPGENRLRYRDRNLIGYNFGVIEPFFRIHSAERKGDEIWIRFQPVLARRPGDSMGIVFRESGRHLIGQRTFEGKDFSGNKDFVRVLTWTRCSVASG